MKQTTSIVSIQFFKTAQNIYEVKFAVEHRGKSCEESYFSCCSFEYNLHHEFYEKKFSLCFKGNLTNQRQKSFRRCCVNSPTQRPVTHAFIMFYGQPLQWPKRVRNYLLRICVIYGSCFHVFRTQIFFS